jgi:AcrR family transcriptional regulator
VTGKERSTATAARRRPNPRGEGSRLREDILGAAVRLIARVGSIDAVSLRRIAREAGIDPMSIYRHFVTKEELVWAVLDAEFAELARVLDEAETSFDDPVERLRARCLAYVGFGLERAGEFVVLFGTEGRPTPPQAATERLPGWPVFAAFVAAVDRCRLEVRPGERPDATTLATLLWVALHGATVLRLSKRGFPWPPIEQMVDELLRHLVIEPSADLDR